MTITLSQALAKTDIRPRALISIEPRAKIEGWFLTGGKTYTFETAWTERRPSAVSEDGTDLIEKTSNIAEVEATDGSWYWDRAAGKIYVHTSGDDSPANYTILLETVYRFCGINAGAITWDGHVWEPFITSAPTIADSVPDLFFSQVKTEQISFSIQNSEGYFDIISRLFYWENALVKVYYGVADLDFTGFETGFIGILKDPGWELDAISFSACDLRAWLQEQIPADEYKQDTYPGLADADIGKAIPIVYGPWSYFPTVKISASPRKYKIAGHRINALTAVRIAGTPTSSANYTADLPNGEFTLTIDPGASAVTADIEGKHDGTKYLTTGVDQVRDLLKYSIIPTVLINDASFTTAAADNPAVTRLAVETKTNISDLLSTLFKDLFLLFYFDASGLLSIKAWKPEIPASTTRLEESDLITEPKASSTTEQIFFKVDVAYDQDYADDEPQHYIAEDSVSALIYKRQKTITVESATLIEYADALNAASYYLFVSKSRSLKISAAFSPRALGLKIGDKVRLNYSRAPHLSGELADRYFEITGYSKNLNTFEVTLDLDDMKGLGTDLCIITADDHPNWAASTEEQRDAWGYLGDGDGFVDPELKRKKYII